MKYQVLLAFTLLYLASHYTEVVAPTPPPTKNCTKPGYLCESCTSLVTCIRLGGDEFTKSNREACPKGTTCKADKCTADVNPPCQFQGLNFPCRYQGMYPDPADWSKYVYCVPGSTKGSFTAYRVNCEEGSGYNALTGYCDKILKDIDEATYPVPICEKSHTMLPLPQNPSIYYECEEYSTTVPILYPFQSTCPKGGIYSNFECTAVTPPTETTPVTD